MLTLDEYKSLVAPHLAGLPEETIRQLYEFDVTIASFALKVWRERRCPVDRNRGKVVST